MNEQCKQIILSYVSEETQRNALLFGEHLQYTQIAIKLLRDEYARQVELGASQFIVPDNIHQYLITTRPW